jgi:hypothetical protein
VRPTRVLLGEIGDHWSPGADCVGIAEQLSQGRSRDLEFHDLPGAGPTSCPPRGPGPGNASMQQLPVRVSDSQAPLPRAIKVVRLRVSPAWIAPPPLDLDIWRPIVAGFISFLVAV